MVLWWPKMRAIEQDLIQRLGERNADRKRATDRGIHPRKPVPEVAIKELKAAEREIGFRLPELVRAKYLGVGNGGFGPEFGMVGINGGPAVTLARAGGGTQLCVFRAAARTGSEYGP